MVTILVVDECPAVRQFVDLVVGSDEVQVAGASDGLAALDSAMRTRPDLVLAATGLSGLGGPALAAKLSSVGIPVVMMTGSLDPSAHDAGSTDVRALKKPLQLEALRAAVSAITLNRTPAAVAVEVCDDTVAVGSTVDPIAEWLDDADSTLGLVPRRWRSLAVEGGDLHSFAHDVAAVRDGRVQVRPLRFSTRRHA